LADRRIAATLAWLRWQVPYIAFCYAYFPVTLTKRVLLKRKREYLGLDPIVRRFWDKWGGTPRQDVHHRPVWINMNSGGEMMMSEAVLRRLNVDRPEFVLSTEAYDSFQLMSKRYGLERVFFPPWDTWLPVARSLRRVRPRALVFVQNAYFPILLRVARRRGIKTLLVNGLLSRNMARGNPTMDRAAALEFYRELDAVAVQTEADAAAFRALGVAAERIEITGDLSADLEGVSLTPHARRQLRDELGFSDGPVLIVGSTHPGERHAVVDAFKALRRRMPNVRFIVAPRQLHEAWFFTEACTEAGFRTVTRTESHAGAPARSRDHDVLILNTFGELRRVYGVADVALIGSSLVPLNDRGGGHNPLEPLAHGVVPLFGPHMNLWLDAVAALREAWALIQVDGPEAVADRAADVLNGRAPIGAVRAAGAALIHQSGGSVARTVDFLVRELGLHSSDMAASPEEQGTHA
jgi:3-deoxy-D-manno-octulosonic-acid transferase